MNSLADLNDWQTFTQAADSFAQDRPALVSLKRELIAKKEEIELQLQANEIHGGRDNEWEGRARMARGFTVQRISHVDSLLSKLKQEGGWLLWVVGPKHEGWVATKRSPTEWTLKELEAYGDQARGILFSLVLTVDQLNRLPPEMEVET